ncbi:MAG TPA: STAS domain-containing protein [Spirochaetota bacterium]|nr:STAS domain-containing protein [Spirochaetota bacterium]HNT09660.1 STAS domain-containing protein [Spirochaetota bacterium]HNV45400.1 STAS domain-containing protein [Spirochaetota bacterium]HOS39285.1 STAS domain-containing protein [Spirochaetota bacterium]HPU88025.1 STAS domain-containing protein [Spirochaetota bacterium]
MLDISIDRKDRIAIMHIAGDFYIDSIASAERSWNEVVAAEPRIIALDCRKLARIDSTAIGTLVKFFNMAMAKKIRLVFCDVNASIQLLFETARLKRHFVITSAKKFNDKYLRQIA